MTTPSARVLRSALVSACAAVLLSLLAACTTSHRMEVNALSRPKAEEKLSYRIRSANPQNAEDTLRFQEAARFVKTALSGRGLYEAPKAELADVVIDLDYGLGPPEVRQEVVKEPVYRTVAGRTYVTTVVVGTDKSGRPITQRQVHREPDRQEFAGYREYLITNVYYEKYLKMSARENNTKGEGGIAREVWTVDVRTEGKSDDLRKHLPVLAAASIDHIAEDTRGKVDIRLKADSPDIEFVKKGM